MIVTPLAALRSNLDILKDVEKAVCEDWPSKDIESLSQKCRTDILKDINANGVTLERSRRLLSVCQFSQLQFPDTQKVSAGNRNPLR